jgi:hypothetical protein
MQGASQLPAALHMHSPSFTYLMGAHNQAAVQGNHAAALCPLLGKQLLACRQPCAASRQFFCFFLFFTWFNVRSMVSH